MAKSVASDAQFAGAHRVRSPCIGRCGIDASRQYCTGCYRTIAEIMSWPTLSAAQKREINAQVEKRRSGLLF